MPSTPAHRFGRLARTALTAAVLAGASGCSILPAPSAPEADSSDQPSVTSETSALPSFDPSSAVAEYAPGFPADLLGAPEEATILASSAHSTEDGQVEVSLSLSTTQGAGELVDHYAERLDAAGFEESETVDASGLTARTAYTRTRGDDDPAMETVMLGVHDDGDHRLVSVSGVVVPQDG